MRFRNLGHAVFAATMIALGITGLVMGPASGNFSPTWDPVPSGVTPHVALMYTGLIYLCAFISLACGIGLLWQRTAAPAARVLFAWLLIWFLQFRLIPIVKSPTMDRLWPGFEGAVVLAGAWVLYIGFATGWDRQRFGFVAGDGGLLIARVLYGLALIFFGLGHFIYPKNTVSLVPGWLPWHLFWAYFFGCTFIAAGVAVIVGLYARLAAALAAFQLGMFVVLVWVPIVAKGSASTFQWSETVVSWALTAGAWVIADSYRGMPWVGLSKRRPRA